MDKFISQKNLENFNEDFKKNPSNLIARNAVTSNGINAAARNFDANATNQFGFSIDIEAGEVCNQKQSGRCWMFAAYNVMRLEIMNKLNIKNMELSQNYPLFFDKLERSNYFLENILDTLDEELNSRIVHYLLQDPVGDGGQWDMFRSIVEKYGVVPKELMPETKVSSATTELRTYLTKKLRQFACELRTAHKAGEDMSKLRVRKEVMMNTVYRMLTISLGEPPKKFTWETRDKDNNFIKIKDITPVEFFNQYVGWNLDDYVTVINAPTKDKPYGKTYTVSMLGTVKNGKYPVKYLNLPMEDLKTLTIKQLKDGKAVWFGSDVGQFSNREEGLLTLDAYNVSNLFDTDFPMTKEQRLDYCESLMTHAMVITGVDLDENDRPIRWKVENSWGKDRGKDGFYVLSDEWFEEYAYQILLDRKYFTDEQAKQFDLEPIVLKPWDPMGSLA